MGRVLRFLLAGMVIGALTGVAPAQQAGPTVELGDHQLEPDTADQSFSFDVTGGGDVAGLDLALQVGDGESTKDPEPAVTGVDLETQTIFANNNTGQTDNGSNAHQKFFSITTESGTVTAEGRLASLTVDTSGIDTGRYRLTAEGVLGVDSKLLAPDGSEVPASFVDGSIGIGASPEVVWTGAGSDQATATGPNWNGLASPRPGDTVVFAGDGAQVQNDLASGTTLAAVRFASGAGTFTIGGNTLAVKDGGAIANKSSKTQTIEVPVTAEGAFTLDAASGNLALSGGLTLQGAAVVKGSAKTTLSGAVTGEGSLTKRGEGQLELSAANTYAGATRIEAGTLVAAGGSAIPDSGRVELADASSAVFSLDADETIGALAGGGSSGGAIDLGDSRLTVAGSAETTFAGVIRGSGGLTRAGDGALELTADHQYTGVTRVEGGVLRLNGSVAGPAEVAGGELAGAGRVGGDLTVGGGTVSPGNSIGTMRVEGNFTLEAGGTLDAEIAPAALDQQDAQAADRVVVGGNASLAENATVRVRTVGEGALEENDTFTLIDTQGGSVNDAGAALKGPAIMEFKLKKRTGDGRFQVRVADVSNFAEATRGSANPETGRALNRAAEAADRGSRRAARLVERVGDFTERELRNFVKQTNASARNADITTAIAVNQSQAFSAEQGTYLAARRGGRPGLASAGSEGPAAGGRELAGGPMLVSAATNPQRLSAALGQREPDGGGAADDTGTGDSGLGGYVRPFGVFANQDPTESSTGYQSDGYGIQAGLDHEIGDDWIAGLAFGYAETDAILDGGLGSLSVDSYRIGPYASYQPGKWFLDLSATYASHDHESTRRTNAGTASGSFDADEVTFYSRGGYRFDLGEKLGFGSLRVIPAASLRYSRFDREAYTEQGAGALSFESHETNTLYSRLGARVENPFDALGMTVVPEAQIAWEHEYLQDSEEVEATFPGGGGFTIDTSSPESDALVLGSGLSLLFNPNVSAFVRYEGTFSDRGEVHAADLGVNIRF